MAQKMFLAKVLSILLVFCFPIALSMNFDQERTAEPLEMVSDSINDTKQSINLHNSALPRSASDETLIGTFNNGKTVNDICIVGNYAYTAGINLSVVDISNPALPAEIGSLSLSNYLLNQIEIKGDLLYVFDEIGVIYAININNPQVPVLINSYATVCGMSDMQIAGEVLYYTDYTSVFSLNISNPLSPSPLDSISEYADIRGICIVDSYMYVSDYTASMLFTLNISNSSSLETINSLTLPNNGLFHKFYLNDVLYISDGDGFTAVNISSRASPSLISTVSVAGMGYNIHVENNKAYIATLNNGLQIFDIEDIYSPITLNTYPTSGITWRLEKNGIYLYSCEKDAGFRIFQISQYEEHEPIYINGDAQLESFPNKTGDGTLVNPYVIQNLAIDAHGTGSGIYILNTHTPLSIENCIVSGSDPANSYAGINIESCSNVTVQYCEVFNNHDGIYLVSCSNCSVINNIAWGNLAAGIQIHPSTDISITTNQLLNNAMWGMKLNGATFTTIQANIFKDSNGCGLTLQTSNNNSIIQNTFENNTGNGLEISDYSNENFISSNNFSLSGGMVLGNSLSNVFQLNNIEVEGNQFVITSSDLNIIRENYFGPSGDNFVLSYSDDNTFWKNRFVDGESPNSCIENANNNLFYQNSFSNPTNAFSISSSLTFWDNGTIGNYWGDYEEIHPTATNNRVVWSNAYDVGSSNYDYYPLVIDPTRTASEPIKDVLCYWDANQNANDSINNISGYLVGDCSYSDGLYQEGFKFNGDGYVNIPHNDQFNFGSNDFAIDLWVNFEYTNEEMIIAEKYIQGAVIEGWSLTKLNANYIRVQLPENALDVSVDIIPQTWNHIILARNQNEISISWNNEVKGTLFDSTNLDCDASLKLGHRGNPDDTPGSLDWGGYYLHGMIDEVQISTHLPSISKNFVWDDLLTIGHYQQQQGYAQGVFVAENFAYVVYEQNGLDILDISDPANPTLCSNYYSGGGNSFDIEVQDGIAYIADGELGILVLNVNNVYSPQFMTYLNDGYGYTRGLTVEGDILYVADGIGGLETYNISDPYNIVECDEFGSNDSFEAWDVVIEDHYAYVAWGYNGLRIIDISNPNDLQQIGSCNPAYECRDVKIADAVAYLAFGEFGMAIIDTQNIGDYTGVSKYSTYNFGNPVYSIEHFGDIVIIGGECKRFDVVDVSNLAQPVKLFQGEQEVSQILFAQNKLFTACREDGLYIISALESHEQFHIDGNAGVDEFFSGSERNGLSWDDAYLFEYQYISTVDNTQGIMISNCDRYIIIRFCIFDNPFEVTDQRHGIETYGSSNIRIENCLFRHFYYGVVTRGSNTEIHNNLFYDCRFGTEIRSGNSVIVSNNLYYSSEVGISMSDNSQSAVIGNSLYEISATAISIFETSDSTFNENILTDGTIGISLDHSANNFMDQNNITNINGVSLLLSFSDSNTIEENNFYFTSDDNVIFLDNSNNNALRNNQITVSPIYAGIYLANSNNNIIEYNTINGCQFGLDSPDSSGNIIRYNTFNVLNECFLDQMNSNTFENNNCYSDGDGSDDGNSDGDNSDGDNSGGDNPFGDFDLSSIPGFTFEGILIALFCSITFLGLITRKNH
ncbi:NosD domain-containing protein [Candidatus Lokiarchaeum ossiferum]|uniref:NosD domain-containing protein n=1 Tax=Candidatus Lokiarchaeum ossiferum TaxID=2951803 RepID=UPI00352D4AC0